MVNPQKEDGYTAIANEIMNALARIRIAGEARQMLDVIIRKTYGYNKKSDQIATSQFIKLTGLSRPSVHKNRKKLLYMNLITVTQKGYTPKTYMFNKDFETWGSVSKKGYTQKSKGVYTKKVTNCIPKGNIQKTERQYTKDSIADKSAKPVFKRSQKEKDPLLKYVIEHICNKWQEKKDGNKYVFNGKHAKLIKNLCRVYDHASIMALWDLYLLQEDDFYIKCGYSIGCFCTSMPKLVDLPYKNLSRKYESVLHPEISSNNPLSKLNIDMKEISK